MGIRPIGNSALQISPVSTVRQMAESAAVSAYGDSARVRSIPDPAAGSEKLFSAQSSGILSADEQKFFERMFSGESTALPGTTGYHPHGQRAIRGLGNVIDRRG
jgi:hypothetical protein